MRPPSPPPFHNFRRFYLPFGAGPRTCIGVGMAMLETQLVLEQIVQRFKVHLVPDHPVETLAEVTLKSRYDMPVTLSRRWLLDR